jgi:RND superfamily putative drug exporter
VVVAITLGQLAGTHELSDAEQSTGESARAQQMLASAGFGTPASESVLVKSATLTVDAPQFRAAVAAVTGTLRGLPQTNNVRTGSVGESSKDRHAQLVEFDMKGKADTADKRVQPVLDAVAGLQRAHPSFTVAQFGLASANNTIQTDFQHAESLSVPITFVILLFAFGAFVAAGVPGLLAFTAVLGLARALATGESRVSCLGRHPVGDAADGDGGRGRLLAVLSSPRGRWQLNQYPLTVMHVNELPLRPE